MSGVTISASSFNPSISLGLECSGKEDESVPLANQGPVVNRLINPKIFYIFHKDINKNICLFLWNSKVPNQGVCEETFSGTFCPYSN